ncbi:MAG: sulfatase, partial [Candidatus Rokubacteria bacterium]|nr:sulfatase [Candidatus Rokubacteria bacterium]
MRVSDALAVAVWTATVFGFLEGVALSVSRLFPAVLAPYKVSLHALWIAPALDLPLFLLAAAGLLPLLGVIGRWRGARPLLITHGVFVFLGTVTVVTAPAVIHPIAATLLSLGVTAAWCRGLSGTERRLTDFLRRRLLWIPALLLAAWAGVAVYDKAREMWLFRHLPPAEADAPNVLLIVLDTVRRDSVGRPAERSLTPNLDRIAAGGVRFENAWVTSSWSLASQASILTGRYPHEHGADWPDFRLDDRYPTLAEFFSRRGYVTGAFSGNAAWVTPEYLGRGFLRFNAYLLEDLLRRTVHGRKLDRLLGEVGYHAAGRGKKAPTLNAEFLAFLDDYRSRPFFAYLCYMDVNQAFHDRRLNPGFRRRATRQEVIEAYEGGMRALDAEIARLFSELDRRRLLDRTLVVITSDHGESFGAEADDHDPPDHGTSLYP